MFDSAALKGYLSEHGISESAIAVKAGLTTAEVKKIISGSPCSVDSYVAICSALGVAFGSFVHD